MQEVTAKDSLVLKNAELELFCCHSIRLNHDNIDINVNKLVEIICVGITKQIMPRPSGDMAPSR